MMVTRGARTRLGGSDSANVEDGIARVRAKRAARVHKRDMMREVRAEAKQVKQERRGVTYMCTSVALHSLSVIAVLPQA